MLTAPLVSVIIPTYNAEPFIVETIHSALNQTYAAVEVIVVDDCSTDKTRDILSTFGQKIKVIRNEYNIGVSRSRNKGIDASTGDFIALLDHDDIWHSKKLETQMKLFDNNNELGLVFSDMYYQTSHHLRWRSFQVDPPFRGFAFYNLLQHNFIPCLTAIFSRDVFYKIGKFQSKYHFNEDYDLFLRISEHHQIDYVDAPLATYRIHDKNFSRNTDIRYKEWIDIVKSHRAKSNVQGTMAMLYISWAKEIYRSGRNKIRAIFIFLKGLIIGITHPIEFIREIRSTLKKRVRSKNKFIQV